MDKAQLLTAAHKQFDKAGLSITDVNLTYDSEAELVSSTVMVRIGDTLEYSGFAALAIEDDNETPLPVLYQQARTLALADALEMAGLGAESAASAETVTGYKPPLTESAAVGPTPRLGFSAPPLTKNSSDVAVKCADCKQAVTSYAAGASLLTAEQVVELTSKRWKQVLCAPCSGVRATRR